MTCPNLVGFDKLLTTMLDLSCVSVSVVSARVRGGCGYTDTPIHGPIDAGSENPSEGSTAPTDKIAALPPEIIRGLETLLAMPTPGDFAPKRWAMSIAVAIRLAEDWGARALALGWSTEDLFGLHPSSPHIRFDAMGLAFMLGSADRVIAMSTSMAVTRKPTGSTVVFRRRPDPCDSVPAWRLCLHAA
jgi:hypothetical protein